MSADNTLEIDVLAMVAKGTDPAWRASASGYLALFTADPTETGSLAAECADSGYARLLITKSTLGPQFIGVLGIPGIGADLCALLNQVPHVIRQRLLAVQVITVLQVFKAPAFFAAPLGGLHQKCVCHRRSFSLRPQRA
jgi:hypothetical protein